MLPNLDHTSVRYNLYSHFVVEEIGSGTKSQSQFIQLVNCATGIETCFLILEHMLFPPCPVASALTGLVYSSSKFEFGFDQLKLYTWKETHFCATANHFYHIEGLRIMCSCKNYGWNDLNMQEDIFARNSGCRR